MGVGGRPVRTLKVGQHLVGRSPSTSYFGAAPAPSPDISASNDDLSGSDPPLLGPAAPPATVAAAGGAGASAAAGAAAGDAPAGAGAAGGFAAAWPCGCLPVLQDAVWAQPQKSAGENEDATTPCSTDKNSAPCWQGRDDWESGVACDSLPSWAAPGGRDAVQRLLDVQASSSPGHQPTPAPRKNSPYQMTLR